MIDPVDLSQKLVRCPSVTPADAGAQDVLIETLKPLGFEIHDITSNNIRNTFFRLGSESPHFCFCGHTDVVPAGDETSWSYPPFSGKIHDGILYGRGVADMKGNIACFVSALSDYLKDNDLKGSISLLITGDEEGPATNGTVKVLKWMKANDQLPNVALVGEPTNPEQLGDEIKIGRRGSLTGIIKVNGVQGHVAYPQLADNPLPKLVKLADALVSHTFDEGSAFFPPTNLELTTIDTGNTADNVIPEKSEVHFNVRFNDQWNAQSLEKRIREILDAAGHDYILSCESNAESFLTTPGKLTTLVTQAVEEVTGRKPELSTKGGTSDARFVQNYCPVVEFGLINKTIHQVDEHASIEDLKTLTTIYKKILEKIFSPSGMVPTKGSHQEPFVGS